MKNIEKTETKTAGVIYAAGKNCDIVNIGKLSNIRRIILNFQLAGVSPIIVIIGYKAEEMEYHLADYGIIFIHEKNYKEQDMFQSAKNAFSYLKDKCNRFFFTPINIPLFTCSTLRELMQSKGPISSPTYNRKSGHPLLLDICLIDEILSYEGKHGLRGYLKETSHNRDYFEVNDEGILKNIDSLDETESLYGRQNKEIMRPYIRVSIEKECRFFDSRSKLLLQLIHETGSVKKACDFIALSVSQAWKMLNRIEDELGYPLVERKQGGKGGGHTILTPKGIKYLDKYISFEEEVQGFARDKFKETFME